MFNTHFRRRDFRAFSWFYSSPFGRVEEKLHLLHPLLRPKPKSFRWKKRFEWNTDFRSTTDQNMSGDGIYSRENAERWEGEKWVARSDWSVELKIDLFPRLNIIPTTRNQSWGLGGCQS